MHITCLVLVLLGEKVTLVKLESSKEIRRYNYENQKQNFLSDR